MSNISNSSLVSQLYSASGANSAKSISKNTKEYGKTVGEPQLSDKAKDYYESLKEKYNKYDFVLVGKDEVENAKQNAASYATGNKTVVLISEDEVEAMATDENARKKYESILDNASSQISELEKALKGTGANVKGYGIQINSDGTTSMFAVLKDSSSKQKERIEAKAEASRAEKKAQAKQAEKKRLEKSAKGDKTQQADDIKLKEDGGKYTVISANSVEELVTKIGDYTQEMRTNAVQTEAEKSVGQTIDFRG